MSQDQTDQIESKSTFRGIVSLLILVHFFFVFVALSGSWIRSPLQARILSQFACYTQLLNFDPDFTPYYLTHASINDVDHRIEVLPAGEDADSPDAWLVLPDKGWNGSERYKRYQRLAATMAQVSVLDAQAARIAESVAGHFSRSRGIEPSQVRCRRHTLQSWEQVSGGNEAERNANSETFFDVAYAADVLLFGGEIGIKKHEARSQVAQPGERE